MITFSNIYKNPRSGFFKVGVVFIVALSFLVSSCTPGLGPESPDSKKFVECLYTENFSLVDAANDVMDQYGITKDMLGDYRPLVDIFLSMDINYSVHAISYRTVTPEGKPVVASGVLYYPCAGEPAGVIEISPVNKSKGTCGTEEYYMAEILPGMVKNYICIVPDLIGCGSSADLPISYLQHENTAIVSADMRKAAEEFVLEQYGYQLPSSSILFGYSLGGSCVLSLERLYEKNNSYGVNVAHVFAGGGAYEPYQVVKAQIAQDRSDYAIIPNILLSMMYYDHLDLNLNEIFKGPLLEHYEEWCDGYMPIADLTQLLGTHPSDYFSEKFIKEFDRAEKYKPLMDALNRKSLPLDWKPKAKIHLSHAVQDYYVPTICGDRLNEHFKKIGADVQYKKYDCSHVMGAIYIGADFFKFLMSYSGDGQ